MILNIKVKSRHPVSGWAGFKILSEDGEFMYCIAVTVVLNHSL